jgi:hypothetical protein
VRVHLLLHLMHMLRARASDKMLLLLKVPQLGTQSKQSIPDLKVLSIYDD